MKRRNGMILILCMVISIGLNGVGLAKRVTGTERISSNVTYGDLEITSSGSLIFSNNLTITVNGDCDIAGVLRSHYRNGNSGGNGGNGSSGDNGVTNDIHGKNGAPGENGTPGSDGSSGRNLSLIVEGTLTITGDVQSKGGNGGVGGNGGHGGDGGNGFSGERDEEVVMQSSGDLFEVQGNESGARGGNGGDGGNNASGGSGGDGGDITIKATRVILSSNASLDVGGGSGDSAGDHGHGGDGGAGGTITYTDPNSSFSVTGPDGTPGSDGNNNGNDGSDGISGLVKIIAPIIELGQYNPPDYVDIYTDIARPEIRSVEFDGFDADNCQNGLDPKIIVTARDLGMVYADGTTVAASGLDRIQLVLESVDHPGERITLTQNVVYGGEESEAEKSVLFSLAERDLRGTYRVEILAYHQNFYNAEEKKVAYDQEIQISFDNEPPTPPEGKPFSYEKVDDELVVSWEAWEDNVTDSENIKYNYYLVKQMILPLPVLWNDSPRSETNLRYEYKSNEKYKIRLQGFDELGNASEYITYDTFCTDAESINLIYPQIYKLFGEIYAKMSVSKVKASSYDLQCFQTNGMQTGESVPVEVFSSFYDTNLDINIGPLETHGEYQISAVSINEMGQETTPVIQDFSVPNYSPNRPENPTFMPADNSFINTVDVEFVIDCWDDPDGDQIRYNLYIERLNESTDTYSEVNLSNKSMSIENGQAKKNVSLLANAHYRWYVQIQDYWGTEQGMIQNTTPHEFTIDMEAPLLVVSYPEYTNAEQVTLSILDSSDDIVDILLHLDGQDYSLTTDSISVNLSSDGEHTGSIKAIDRAGNETTKSIAILKDSFAPVIDEITVQDFESNDQVSISWAAHDVTGGSGITEYHIQWEVSNLVETTEPLSLPANITSYSIHNLIPNVQYTVFITAIDTAGNSTTLSHSFYCLPEYMGYEVEHLYEKLPDGSYLHYDEYQISGTGYQYQILKSGSGEIDPDNWVNLTEPFIVNVSGHEIYTAEIILRNVSGNTITAYEYRQVSNIPPGPPVNTASHYIGDAEPVLSYEPADDPDDLTLEYYYTIGDENGQIIIEDGQTIPDLEEGIKYYYQVKAVDSDFAEAISDPTWFVIDLTAPEITITENPDNPQGWVSELDLTISVADNYQTREDLNSGLQGVRYGWDQTLTEVDWQSMSAVNLTVPEGDHILRVQAKDQVGNISPVPLEKRYQVDRTPPQILESVFDTQLVQGQYYSISSQEIPVRFQLIDAYSGVEQYQLALVTEMEKNQLELLELDRFVMFNDVNPSQQEFSHLFNGSFDQGESYYLVIRAWDQVGNRTDYISTTSVMIDTTPPVIKNINIDGVISHANNYFVQNINQLNVNLQVQDSESGLKSMKFGLTSGYYDQPENWMTNLSDLNFTTINSGDRFYLWVKVTDRLNQSRIETVGRFVYDDTPPAISQVKLGNYPDFLEDYIQGDDNQLVCSWAVDEESEIPLQSIRIGIGMSPGNRGLTEILPGADEQGWLNVPALKGKQEMTLTGLELVAGTYYLEVQAKNILGLWSIETTQLQIEPMGALAPLVMLPVATSRRDELSFKVRADNYADFTAYQYQILNDIGEVLTVGEWSDIYPNNSETLVVLDLSATPLTAGQTYYVGVQGVYGDGTRTEIGYSRGMIVDITPPEISGLVDNGYLAGKEIVLDYSVTDSETAILAEGLTMKVGSQPDGEDLTKGWMVADSLLETRFDSTDFVHGRKYFVTLKAVNEAGLESVARGSFIYDTTPPPVPEVWDFAEYLRPDRPIKVNWQFTQLDLESGLAGFDYLLTTYQGIPADAQWREVTDADLEQVDLDGDGITDIYKYVMSITHPEIINGQRYFVAIKGTNQAGLSSIGFTDGFTVDGTAPYNMTVHDYIDYLNVSSTTLSVGFQAVEDESSILQYYYQIGNDLVEGYFTEEEITFNSEVELNLHVVHGDKVFVRGKAENVVGLISETGMSDGILVDLEEPVMNYVRSETPEYTGQNEQLAFYWQATPSLARIIGYEYQLITNPGSSGGSWKLITEPRITLYGPFENGQTYYLRVRALDAKGAYSDSLLSPGITIASEPPVTPTIVRDSLYSSSGLEFRWRRSSEDEIGGYRYAIGSLAGGDDMTQGWVYLDQEHTANWDQIADQLEVRISGVDYVEQMETDTFYFLKVEACNRAGLYSDTAYGSGFKIDKTPPEKPVVYYQGIAGDDILTETLYVRDQYQIPGISFTSMDVQTGLAQYRYAITANPDTFTFADDQLGFAIDEVEDFQFTGLSTQELEEGGVYYLAVSVQNGVGEWSEIGFGPAITVDTTPPELQFVEPATEVVTNGESTPIYWYTDETENVIVFLTLPEAHPEWGVEPRTTSVEIMDTGQQSYDFMEQVYGIYLLEIYQEDAAGNGASIQQRIRVNEPPVVDIPKAMSLYQGRIADVGILYLNDPDGDEELMDYLWVFEDGEIVGEEASVQYTFNEKGEFPLRLTVTDMDGGVGSDLITIRVTNTLAGSLEVDEVWDEDLTLVGTIEIPENKKLEVLSGVNIEFPLNEGLIVNGSLTVSGTETEPVSFDSESKWLGVNIKAHGQEIVLQNLQVLRADRGIVLQDLESLVLEGLYLYNNEIGLHLFNTDVILTNCIFENNKYYGVKEDEGSTTQFINCEFSGNGAAALYDEVKTLVDEEGPGNSSSDQQ